MGSQFFIHPHTVADQDVEHAAIVAEQVGEVAHHLLLHIVLQFGKSGEMTLAFLIHGGEAIDMQPLAGKFTSQAFGPGIAEHARRLKGYFAWAAEPAFAGRLAQGVVRQA